MINFVIYYSLSSFSEFYIYVKFCEKGDKLYIYNIYSFTARGKVLIDML